MLIYKNKRVCSRSQTPAWSVLFSYAFTSKYAFPSRSLGTSGYYVTIMICNKLLYLQKTIMEIERSLEPLTKNDLNDLYNGSVKCLSEYFVTGKGQKWQHLYDISQPLVVALCQGAAMHYHDKTNGIKDFDIWFFYPFNQKHLPYRTCWNWDYQNPKFDRHPLMPEYKGRKVDVLVRSIRNYSKNDPIKTIHNFLQYENTTSSKELAKKAVVLLTPELLGKVVWYKEKI